MTGDKKGAVLIIEDEDALRLLLTRLLEDFTVDAVGDGKGVLEKFAPGRYAAALVDLSLPDMSGDEVAAWMRRQDPSLATVLMSGWVMEPDDARLACFDFQLPKPFDDLDDVVEVLTRAIELHQSRVHGPQETPGSSFGT